MMVPLTEKGRGTAVYIFILADGVGGWRVKIKSFGLDMLNIGYFFRYSR